MTSSSQVITLCGSARFERLFKAWKEALTLAGHTVFDLVAYPSDKAGVKQWYTDEQKEAFDASHLRKIELSDAIFVINRHGYVGPSTLREIAWARKFDKTIYFLESWGDSRIVEADQGQEERDAAEADGINWPLSSPLDTSLTESIWSKSMMGEGGPMHELIVRITQAAKDRPSADAAIQEILA